MAEEVKRYGVTDPISLACPTAEEKEQTESLLEALKEAGVFESEEDAKTRLMVDKFVKEISALKIGEAEASSVSGKIFTFGSYRLGVHSSNADIDTLCVCPHHVERNDFFTLFFDMLNENSEITELTRVPDAYVPVIKMRFCDIPIDLVFARLLLHTIPEDLNLLDYNILKNLDEKCILSLNGSRVTDEILRLVPNTETFHIALRCIKYWAQRRALYGNVMGYLGGVAYAMLVARICQLYPNAAAFVVVARFFKIFSQWQWPQPVLLKRMEEAPLQMRVWNPSIYPTDRYHKMPIITPAYPSMCATHNVSSSCLSVITSEFSRGSELTLKIEQNLSSWRELFLPTDFFYRYRHYFQVIGYSTNEDDHRIWHGFIESKLRHLGLKLEPITNVLGAYPYPKPFDINFYGENVESVVKKHSFFESELSESETTSESRQFFTSAFYVGLAVEAPKGGFQDLTLDSSVTRKLYVERPIEEFKSMLNDWEKKSSEMESLVRYVRRDFLPNYVFEGSIRPPKSKKSKKKMKTESK